MPLPGSNSSACRRPWRYPPHWLQAVPQGQQGHAPVSKKKGMHTPQEKRRCQQEQARRGREPTLSGLSGHIQRQQPAQRVANQQHRAIRAQIKIGSADAIKPLRIRACQIFRFRGGMPRQHRAHGNMARGFKGIGHGPDLKGAPREAVQDQTPHAVHATPPTRARTLAKREPGRYT